MTVTKIKSHEEFEKLSCSGKPMVIDFWAAWCGPCKMISPVFEKLSNEIDGLNFVSVDVEDPNFGLQEHGIRAMPTFQIIENGVKVAEMVGADQVKLRVCLLPYLHPPFSFLFKSFLNAVNCKPLKTNRPSFVF
ncbi:uncharacterized protein MELLADRAFT_49470 [Melampsora larici-populina 98AG31]|uniref:Thioredoxin n=1 Tax=Melampsora larici-populina (strain 98AG31 / pathotype 3-4-7) TaxID=747676 RepID=F4RVG1_MELLP|nr:uncharacterized protein MELLADRAFT_49470 [Melampsora larici-populina 98AG31]EGG03677.1 hypothetical protein MELLADRAFT_49470 [Melampsora larici-populina 98AG31]